MSMDSLRTERDAGGVVLLARDGEGRIRGFLHLVPSYGRPAMSLSSMRRDRETPNGLMEFLVVRAIEALRDRGVEELSLNFAAFARVMHGPRGRFERLAGKLVALGNPYFQIESLYRFNAKFFPRWEPRYLLYEGALGLPRAGLAVMWAEGQLPKPRRRVPVEGES
jgi:lysyl-tRNA synthetase class 2